ncbi:SNF2-related protein [Fibrobacter succinogenes subsp. succinogenes S85]|uniref:SNF2-related protein n=1 Tax=Fibrobacter succinogenes (strain ATCC 19169 / S85) TaxID=59374 RepID=A0ABM5LJT8_FIBSS|nr:DEAD/DEAH box helicase [Fibrobacter succinogenes]ACX75888.1 SNF2-related protein [Fibrobacter succinogenes subsp. succinogenes S85]
MDFGSYGKTWWANKWLSSILATASEQAVLQGLKFAARGQVTSIDIVDNRVISVVKGPNGGLHNNYIVFPKFSKESSEVFVSFLKQQPAELLALNNKALSPSLELLMSKSGLQLFDDPAKVNMGCDCRDERPCKYLVATFLKIAEQADKEPNVLFKIHGLDLEFIKDYKPDAMEMEAPSETNLVRSFSKATRLVGTSAENASAIGTAAGDSDEHEAQNAAELSHAEDASASLFGGYKGSGRESQNSIPPKQLPTFDFKSWKDYSHILPAMLQNFPKFCPAGNFRKSFTDELESCHKFFTDFENFDAFSEQFRVNNAKTFLMENEQLRLFHKPGWHWNFEQSMADKVINSNLTVTNVMGALCCLSAGNFSWHHYSVRYLHLMLQVAFYLVRTGAIYPQVFWIGKDVAQMRWLPAEMLPEILYIVADLEVTAPRELAWTSKEESFFEIAEPAEHILSLFISQLLKFARKYKTPLKTNHGNLLSFFFDSVSGKLANNAHAIPGKIQQWLSVYSCLGCRTQILFVCSEMDEDVALDVFVLDEDAASAAGNIARRTPLSELFENNDSRLLSIMSVLNGIADGFKPLDAYLERRASEPILMRGAELLDFLQDCLKKLQLFGIQTEIPKNLLNIGKPKPKMRLQGSMSFGAFTAGDLLDFDWEIAIGDENISAKEFFELAEQADGLLKYKSSYVQITEQDLQSIRDKIEGKSSDSAKNSKGKKAADDAEGAATSTDEILEEDSAPEITQAKLVQACFTGECDNIPVEMASDFKQQFDAWRAETEIPLPENLNATLRPYQMRGYSWMYKNLEIGFGCILADDMGLGKTLQVITFLLKMKQEGKFAEKKAIVVMPAGLLCNWQVEIKKFAPELTFFAYHGGRRDLQKFSADVLLTTYATFRKDFAELDKHEWQTIIIDEAQNIKNADSEQSKLLRRMRAPMKIAMSGTPVENRLMEFWTIMDFANHGFFPSASEFREKFETPIQKNGNQVVAETFRKITAPFMLRRLKTDKSIISDLPDKIIQDEYAELTRSQAALYQKTLEHFMQELEMEQALSEKANDAHALFKRKGIILQMILALKQICNHPATFLKGLAATSAQDAAEVPTESAAPQKSNKLESGKMQMLLDLLTSIQEQGEKTLIFTQFAEMGHLLKSTIESELGLRTHFYHGGCTQTQRSEMIQDFQENPDCKVLILSLKAGGTGLNLVAASQVIHYDLWWNPAIEAQATDRAFRIGQKRNVQVHRFITKGTFEEKINALLETKKAIANLTVNAGETWLADMDDKQLAEVFCLDNTIV